MATSKPVRVQLSRAKGWKLPANTVSVARNTRWGNPFVVGEGTLSARGPQYGPAVGSYDANDQHWFDVTLRDGLTAQECVDLYRQDLEWSLQRIADGEEDLTGLVDGLEELRGKNLACWCDLGADVPCHATVLLEVANR